MNFFENEYTLPVILGNNDEVIDIANIIRKNTRTEIHIFSHHLSFFNKIKFRYHRLFTSNYDIALLSLMQFADFVNESYTPVLIFCNDELEFIKSNFSTLETMYVIVSAKTAKNFFSEGNKIDENY